MQFKKLKNLSNLYIFFFSYLLFINIIVIETSSANNFKVEDLKISQSFELDFNKSKVIDRGFKEAFLELLSMITTSKDKEKIKKTQLSKIKGLIDSFTMSDEKFIDNKYHVNFDVNFNKKNTLDFFEENNIFPSIPKKKKLLLIPVLVDLQSEQVQLFSKNIFYEKWNNNSKRFYLLNYILPNEDIEDLNLISLNSKSIEDYNFQEIIKKYDLNDFIIVIIYKNNNKFKILSKIQLNNSLRIINQNFESINLNSEKDFYLLLDSLKVSYENYWKSINQINTSIKLPLTISIKSDKNNKIRWVEDIFNELDLISKFEISRFNSQNLYFKIIYNGSPDMFINDMNERGIKIKKKNQIWIVE